MNYTSAVGTLEDIVLTASTEADQELARIALEFSAADFGGPLSSGELDLVNAARALPRPSDASVRDIRAAVRAGADPMGDLLLALRTRAERRPHGVFYTPTSIVRPIVDWVLSRKPSRVVDAGCGSGRFALEIAKRQPLLPILAIDIDPLATLVARANLGLVKANGAQILNVDYLTWPYQNTDGSTAFLGNPPYVRYRELKQSTRDWAFAASRATGGPVAGHVGLHALFFLATSFKARPGDIGSFVTSADWLDTRYGSVVRSLFLDGLGGCVLNLLDPRTAAFDAQTTVLVSNFEVGSTPRAVSVSFVKSTRQLSTVGLGRLVPIERFRETNRWSPLLKSKPHNRNTRCVAPLSDLVSVHRGLATGANAYFVLTRQRAHELGLDSWCRPAITSAREIQTSNGVVHDNPSLRVVLVIPSDLKRELFPALDNYLSVGETALDGNSPICERYLTSQRKPWWSLAIKHVPPIVSTYMARQPPIFASNPDGLVVLNIAHGLYPKALLGNEARRRLVVFLNGCRDLFRGHGRIYHGGLEKFEPRDLRSVRLPFPVEVPELNYRGGKIA